MTNYEKIKAMSVEEMARFLDKVEMGEADIFRGMCDVCEYKDRCWECTLHWLQSEVTDHVAD